MLFKTWSPQISKVWRKWQSKAFKIELRNPKFEPKKRQGRGWEASWAVLWRLWKPSWLQVRSGRPLGGVWEGSWAVLTRNWEPRWFQVGYQQGGFCGPKTKRKWMHYWEPLRVRHFNGFWVDFGKQNGIKLASNWCSTSIEHRKVLS